jgi:hypothetical protein
MIERLHRQHAAQQQAIHNKLDDIHEQLFGAATETDDTKVGGDKRSPRTTPNTQ